MLAVLLFTACCLAAHQRPAKSPSCPRHDDAPDDDGRTTPSAVCAAQARSTASSLISSKAHACERFWRSLHDKSPEVRQDAARVWLIGRRLVRSGTAATIEAATAADTPLQEIIGERTALLIARDAQLGDAASECRHVQAALRVECQRAYLCGADQFGRVAEAAGSRRL